MVDTGSFYTFPLPGLVDSLGTIFTADTQVVMADSRTVQVPLSVAYPRHRGRKGGIIVGEMDVPKLLLGASAL